ncbi:phage tail tape measure protein [Eubacteriales bacterium OttesenSCG-928-K08]|nr:phage tail tape measure protein [Eubacteriales bacterium OttesenSCG-928-K08]
MAKKGDGEVVYYVRIGDDYVEADLNKSEQKIKGSAGRIGSFFAAAATAVATAAVAVGGAALKVGMDFEKGMSQVAATMGYTADELSDSTSQASQNFARLEQAARDAGATTKYSATEASEALNYLALAGYDVEKSVAVLPKMLNAASAANVELAYMSDLVTDGMSALGLEIKDLDSFLDQMTRTSQRSNTSMAQLGEAQLTVGGTAKVLKGGTVELNAALGVLADNGIKGSEGGTALRNIILSLTAPTSKAAKSIQALGVEVFDVEGNMRDISEVMADFNLALSGMSEGQKTEALNNIFNKVDLKSVSALMSSTAGSTYELSEALLYSNNIISGGGIDLAPEYIKEYAEWLKEAGGEARVAAELNKDYTLSAEETAAVIESLGRYAENAGSRFEHLTDEIVNSAGATEAAAKTQEDNLKGMVTVIKSQLEELGIQLYQGIEEPLKAATATVSEFLQEMSDTGVVDELAQSIGSLGSTLATSLVALLPVLIELINGLLPPLMQIISTLLPPAIELFSALAEPLMKMVGDILPVLIDLFTTIIAPIMEIAQVLLPVFVEVANALLEPLLELIKDIMPVLIEFLQMVIPIWKQLAEIIKALTPVISALAEILTGVLFDALQGVMGYVEQVMSIFGGLIDFIAGVFTGNWELAWSGIVNIFKGIINIIPAALEGVVNGAIAMINGLIKGVNKVAGALGLGEISLIGNVSIPRFQAGLDYVPNDNFLMYADKGEAVLTAPEAAEWREARAASTAITSTQTSSTNIGSLTINPNAEQWAELMQIVQYAHSAEQMDRAGIYEV